MPTAVSILLQGTALMQFHKLFLSTLSLELAQKVNYAKRFSENPNLVVLFAYTFFSMSAVMAILCVLKRRSNVVKSVCSCGPTINLSLREIPLEDFADPSNTMRNLAPFLLGTG
ncbi:hypothetical protein TNCV_1493501 [Trichonephila clavipes]|nr:hypothetical protein TNCV_1493501 [Trichonephila clavipes]